MSNVILCSACLLGVSCRYDAKRHKIPDEVKDLMDKGVCFIPVCPELLGGLPAPRPRNHLIWNKDVPTVTDADKRDVTKEFVKGAEETLKIAQLGRAQRALFKARSPSCGEQGVTTRLLRDNGIDVQVIDAEKE